MEESQCGSNVERCRICIVLFTACDLHGDSDVFQVAYWDCNVVRKRYSTVNWRVDFLLPKNMVVRCHCFLPESRAPMMRSFSLPKNNLGSKWSDSTEGTWQRFFSLAWVDRIVFLWCHNFPRLGFSSRLQKNDGTRDLRQFVFNGPGLLILSRTHSSESSMTSWPSSLMTECLRLFRCGLPPVSCFLQGSLDEVSFPWITLLFDTLRKVLGRIKKAMSISWIDWDSYLFQDWPLAHADLEPQLSGLSKWSVLEQAEWFSGPSFFSGFLSTERTSYSCPYFILVGWL